MSLKNLGTKLKNLVKATGKARKFLLATYAVSLIAALSGAGVTMASFAPQNKANDIAAQNGFTQYYQDLDKKPTTILGFEDKTKKFDVQTEYMNDYVSGEALQDYNEQAEKRSTLLKTGSAVVLGSATASAVATVAVMIGNKKKQEHEAER